MCIRTSTLLLVVLSEWLEEPLLIDSTMTGRCLEAGMGALWMQGPLGSGREKPLQTFQPNVDPLIP